MLALLADVWGVKVDLLIGVRVHYKTLYDRDWYVVAEQPVPVTHLAHPKECAALRIVLTTVPRVRRACENSPRGFDLHLHCIPDPLYP